MGLDTTHDCWHGAYSAFHRWRNRIAQAVGIDLDKMEGFCPISSDGRGGIPWSNLNTNPLHELLSHSDCDGDIPHGNCAAIADKLDELLPKLVGEDGGGHIGSYVERTQQFIDGLRHAADAGEDVEFR